MLIKHGTYVFEQTTETVMRAETHQKKMRTANAKFRRFDVDFSTIVVRVRPSKLRN